jgi:hypothetical protein
MLSAFNEIYLAHDISKNNSEEGEFMRLTVGEFPVLKLSTPSS